MKYQNLFSGKNKTNISICFLLINLPRMLSVKINIADDQSTTNFIVSFLLEL